MFKIKNAKIFKCLKQEKYHWSKIRMSELMKENGVNLGNQEFTNADLSKGDFRYSDFTNSIIKDSNLEYADISNSDLSSGYISNSCLYNINLSYCSMVSCVIDRCTMSNANLRGVDLRGAVLKQCVLNDADFRYANLEGCDLTGSDIENADFRFSKIKDTKFGIIKGKEVIVQDLFITYPIGNYKRQVIVFKSNIGNVIKCDFFWGLEKDFENYIKEINDDSKVYKKAIKIAKEVLKEGK